MSDPTIKKLIKQGEGQHLELKSNIVDLDSIAEVVTSFLNSGGGTLLIGVYEKKDIVGVENANTQAEKIRDFLGEKITPTPLFSVSVDTDNGRDVITLEVPAAKDFPFVFNGSVYVRSKTKTQQVDAETLRRIVRQQAYETERWERRVSVDFQAKDLVKAEIEETVQDATNARRLTFKNPKNLQEVLRELGLTKGSQFTNAADILFGRDCSNRHPQTRIRAACFSQDKGSDYLDYQIYQGALCLALLEVEKFILRNISVRAIFLDDKLQRDDEYSYPRYAIREGLVNAFAHRDYSNFSGGIAVSIYPSRIEIWNSGRLPKELNPVKLRQKHPSLPTNPDITHVLYIRRFMERIGRGTQKIINACKEQGLPTPTWKDTEDGVTLTLHAAKIKIGIKKEFNQRQKQLLQALAEGETVRPGEYRKRFAQGVSERQARRDLTELENTGLLEKVGSGAASKFRRTNRT